jgi:hypothetical protein
MAHDIDDYDDDAVVKSGKGKEHHMGMEAGSGNDRTVINMGGSDGGGNGGLNAAVTMAALGNRNESRSDIGAILAATQGNRNHDDGLGLGGGLIGGLLLGQLFNRGRGGFGGGDDGCCDNGHRDVSPAHAALLQSLMEGQSDLRAQVPTVALETQNALQVAIAQLALGIQQGLSNVKDSVQANGTANLIATKDNAKDIAVSTLQTQIAITADGALTRELLVKFNNDNLQRELTVAQTALMEERLRGHAASQKVEVNQTVTNTATAIAAQQQQQQQRQDIIELGHLVRDLHGDLQAVKQGQVIFNSGLMAGSGTQSAANTKVA